MTILLAFLLSSLRLNKCAPAAIDPDETSTTCMPDERHCMIKFAILSKYLLLQPAFVGAISALPTLITILCQCSKFTVNP